LVASEASSESMIFDAGKSPTWVLTSMMRPWRGNGPVSLSVAASKRKLNGPKRTTSPTVSFCRFTCTSLTKVPLALLRS
jgi:hypothetical protein